MGKRYDATTKHLIERHPRDWLALAGLPLPEREGIAVVDAELSSITTASDKLIRVDTSQPYLAHGEFETGHDSHLDGRVLVYNVLARWRHRLPVCSVVFLLRPEAQAAGATGRFSEVLGSHSSIDFVYKLIRVWELPVDTVLSAGLGTLPLAPISAVHEPDLPAVINRMQERLRAEASPQDANELWAATQILMGLRFSGELIRQLLKGVQGMEESVTYQEIISKGIERGRAEGRADGERNLLIRMGSEKFGPPDAASLASLNAIADPDELEVLGVRLLRASDWRELLAPEN